jgi:arginyl-tRNA synthetase
MNIRTLLSQRLTQAMQAVGIPADCSPHLSLSTRPEFGDYQANGAMAAAKSMKTNPRLLAEQIIEKLDIDDMAERCEIAGPGFINIHLKPQWLAKQLESAQLDPRLGIEISQKPQTVVVDYSGPNLAKEMHVGHLRSTIIGDAIVRTLEFRGDTVIRQNHMGDWGTQFGMLIAHLEDKLDTGNQLAEVALADLETFYREAKIRFDEESGFADRARDYVVKLQSGDKRCLELWQQFIDVSISHSEEIYNKLNVSLGHQDIHPESAYNDALAPLVKDLQDKNMAVTDAGAQVVFLDELADKEGKPLPVIIQKTDGGYLYATTDIAAARYRAQQLNADRILYFIDARQSLHMQQVFAVSRKAGYVAEQCSLEHHPFGTMMGKDGKPFKTRTGGTVKLAELLDEAIQRARLLLDKRDNKLSKQEIDSLAKKIGIGAVKYADLSKNRTSDYIFSWDAMLSFEGNTAPYLQYAYTRIKSIFRKAGLDQQQPGGTILLIEDAEKALAVKLLQFIEVLDQVSKDASPHLLCAYLYELAGLLMKFYEQCPVLKNDVEPEVRNSRLLICDLTARTLQQGLNLLGIDVMEKM